MGILVKLVGGFNPEVTCVTRSIIFPYLDVFYCVNKVYFAKLNLLTDLSINAVTVFI